MPGDDLAAVVKFVHMKGALKGWSSYNTKAKRVEYLASLSPVWTERVLCDGFAVPPVAAAPTTWPGMEAGAPPPAPPLPPPPVPPPPPVVNYATMTPGERRAQLAALTAAMQAGA